MNTAAAQETVESELFTLYNNIVRVPWCEIQLDSPNGFTITLYICNPVCFI